MIEMLASLSEGDTQVVLGLSAEQEDRLPEAIAGAAQGFCVAPVFGGS